MSLLNRKTLLWTSLQKVKSCLNVMPFKEKPKRFKAIPLDKNFSQKTTSLKSISRLNETLIKETLSEKIHSAHINFSSWKELPLYHPCQEPDVLILLGCPTQKEIKNNEILSYEEKSALEKWMQAININLFSVKKFPWLDSEISLAYPQAKNWFISLIKQVKPKYLLSAGESVLISLLGYPVTLEHIHGIDFEIVSQEKSLLVIPTYSPSEVMYNPSLKRIVWQDLKRLSGIIQSKDNSR